MSRSNAVTGILLGLAVLAVAMMAGCGGSGSGHSAVVVPGTVGTVQLTVAWPQTSGAKAVAPANIPTPTQSIRVEARQNNIVVASCLVVRPASQGTLQKVPCGTTVLGAFACSNPDGTGAVLAEGTTTIVVHTGLNEVANLRISSPFPPVGPDTVYGTLRDAGTGQVLSGANITVTTSDGTQLYQTTADADGTFVLTGVPAGSHLITFSSPGYQTTSVVVVVGSSAVAADVGLTTATGAPPSAPPQIVLNDPVVDQGTGLTALTGTITGLDSDQAVLIQNGQETAIPVTGGVISQLVVLLSGPNHLAVRATNAAGTTLSRTVEADYTGTGGGDFVFRVTLAWDTSGTDIDLHIWSPSNQHCYFGNSSISAGSNDVDNTSGFGPENFTCNVLEPGRFAVAANFYGGVAATNCVVRVASGSLASGASVNQVLGPFALTAANSDSGYPITGNTASWWRPCDVLVSASGVVTVVPPDTSVSLAGMAATAAGARKPKR